MKYAILDTHDENYIEDTYTMIQPCQKYYPNLYAWYFNKVVPQLREDRDIIVCIKDGHLVGIAIIKYSESKVSTLYVMEGYRNKGIGTKLLELCCKTLGKSKPHIAVNNLVLDYYLPLFAKRNFKLVSTHRDYYVKSLVEYSFNNKLSNDNNNLPVKS